MQAAGLKFERSSPMQVGCYEIEIYLTYSNEGTADCLFNNVIAHICVQLSLFIEFLATVCLSLVALNLQLLCKW